MTASSFKQHAAGDDTWIVITGSALDNNNAGEVLEAFQQAQAKRYRYVIVDMQYLQFLSSAGVGSILGVVEDFREANGDIILCNVNESIKHVLDVLDLTDYLTVEQNADSAIASCNKSQA